MQSDGLSRRRFLQIAATMTAGAALAACSPSAPGADTGSAGGTSASSERPEVNIIVQGWVDAAWQITQRAEIYSAENDGEVQVTVTPVPEGWETKALSQIEQGEPLWDGLLTHHPFRFAVQWLAQGLIMPIDEFLATSSVTDMDQFWSSTIAPDLIKADCSVNGKVVGVPIGIDTTCQGFNAQLMEAAGLPSTREDFMAERSWANIQAWAEKIREMNKDQGFWGITTWEVYHQSLGAIFQSITSNLFYEDEGLIRFDSEEMQRALEIQATWSWTDVAPVPAWGQPGEVQDLFPGGRCGLWQGQVGIVARGQRVLGTDVIPYAMPVLVEEGGTGGNQWYTTTGFILNKSRNAQATTDFYLTLFGPENEEQPKLTLEYNWFPIFSSHWEKFVDGDSTYSWVRDFQPQFENAKLIPRNPYYEIEQTVAKKYCELVQAQQISVPDACVAMMEEVRAGVANLEIEWESL